MIVVSIFLDYEIVVDKGKNWYNTAQVFNLKR